MKILLFFVLPFPILAFTILLDPGHGGEEQGAKGQYIIFSKKKEVLEKNLTLSIVKKIKKYLSKKYRVYLTRSVDRDVSLKERAEIAENIQADLFISVHANSSVEKKAHGHEVYYLDNHKNAAVKKLEKIENEGLQSEEDPIVKQILMDLIIEKTVEASKILSSEIHQNLKKNLRRFHMRDRGTKPGLFFVLALAKRPAVLLEIGFMSRASELKKLDSSSFQESYARAIAEGITSYFKKRPTNL